MYDAPDAIGEDMRVTVQVSIGSGIDNTAMDDVTGVTAEALPMCGTNLRTKLFNAHYKIDDMASYEADGFPLDGSRVAVAGKTNTMWNYLDTGVWSLGISDAQGNIDWPISITLSRAHTSAFTIYSANTIRLCTFEYYLGDSMVRSVDLTPNGPKAEDKEVTTYDKIVVRFRQIEPYMHAKVAEAEFGASKTLSNEHLTGRVTYVSEWDPYLRTLPVSQIEFSVVNLYGEYDEDNPDRSDALDRGKIVHLSISVQSDGRQVTYPFGRFKIVSSRAQGEDISVTAQDSRASLRGRNGPEWAESITPSENLRKILDSMGIPSVIDGPVSSEHVVMRDYERDITKVILATWQYTGTYIVPGRDGQMHIREEGSPIPQAPPITEDRMIEYPRPTTGKAFSGVRVKYGNTHSLAILTEGADQLYTIDSPFIGVNGTWKDARIIEDRLKGYNIGLKSSATIISDLRIDVGDLVPIPGKYSQGAPRLFRITRVEHTFDGNLETRLEGY